MTTYIKEQNKLTAHILCHQYTVYIYGYSVMSFKIIFHQNNKIIRNNSPLQTRVQIIIIIYFDIANTGGVALLIQ